ncbi:M56 family metallopeptidase [Paenibacillus donghaensis]|uniref:Peptidase M56 domain-containing protein n=1 Tax=Paenibacillus donghaensis TaxID=414771 RepID=A0A2Z2KCJ9_9BACL|nr:M56 family metallopeptidase [Paenibacillus donghaensis]ASA20710.1 hypothetical protein B9T62_07855 [Paenibacillus donghaensis]
MTDWLLGTTLAGSIASLVLIVLRSRLAKLLGGRRYYALWLMVLLLYLIPLQLDIQAFSPQREVYVEQTGGYPAVTPETTGSSGNMEAAASSTLVAENRIPADHFSLSADQWLLIIWATGAALMLGRYFLGYVRFKQTVTQTVVHSSLKGHIPVVVSSHIHSPMLIGFRKPRIVMPDKIVGSSAYQLALEHERIHHQQKDAWIKLLAVVVNSVHWYNPLSYLALSYAAEACEYAVDEQITRQMKPEDKKRYSEMILYYASQRVYAMNNSLAQPKKQLYRRFSLIMTKDKNSPKSAVAGVMLAVILAVVSVFASSAVFAEPPKALKLYAGAMRTYYDPTKPLEENVQHTLGHYFANKMRVTEGPVYIDANGLKIDYYNRTQPYYRITKKWQDNNVDIADSAALTLSVKGRELKVAFAGKAAAYKNDEIIKEMIVNQITFELANDNHAFIDELLQRGVYVIDEVVAAKDFAFQVRTASNNEIITSNPKNFGYVGWKPLTDYDAKSETSKLFSGMVTLPAIGNTSDGTEGKVIGKALVLKSGKTLTIDVKETTDLTPTVSLSIVDQTTGELVYWEPAAPSGWRYIYTPSKPYVGHSFKVIASASGEQQDQVSMEIFTYKIGEWETSVTR